MVVCQSMNVDRHFMFTHWEGPSVHCHCYIPPTDDLHDEIADQSANVLFVFHGVDRNAESYFKEWLPWVKQLKLVLIVPHFSSNKFPGSANYQLGGTVDQTGECRHRTALWYITDTMSAVLQAVRTTFCAHACNIVFSRSAHLSSTVTVCKGVCCTFCQCANSQHIRPCLHSLCMLVV